MQMKRRVLTAGTTFFLAAATGHVMQNGDTLSARFLGPKVTAAAEVSANPAPIAVTEVAPPRPGRIAEATVTSLSADTTLPAEARSVPELPGLPAADPATLGGGAALAARMLKVEQGAVHADTAADADYDAFGIACAATALNLTVQKPAMFAIKLAAPCHPNERVSISHAGLTVAYMTDAKGALSLDLPALDRSGAVAVRFASGDGVKATRPVPGIEGLHRLAVAWTGGQTFAVNAYENGAAFGAPGHVSAANPRDPATAEGGFLVTLGDPSVADPMLAEVYTAPAQTAVRVETEAEVTPAACGHMATATAIRVGGDGRGTPEPLSVAMPDCVSVGDIVLLDMTPMFDGAIRRAAAD